MANETMRIFFPLKIISYPQYDCSEDEREDISPKEAVAYEDAILAAIAKENRFFENDRGLAKWQDEVKKRAAVNCYTETWLGRRRYLLGIRSSDWGKKSFAERCALNTPIQGTAADILKLACGRIISGLSERLWLKPKLQIHDELVFELPEDKVDEAVVFIKECMETQPFPEFDVAIVAEALVGRNFGEMKEMED